MDNTHSYYPINIFRYFYRLRPFDPGRVAFLFRALAVAWMLIGGVQRTEGAENPALLGRSDLYFLFSSGDHLYGQATR